MTRKKPQPTESALELVNKLHDYGLTYREIARQLDRDPRMISKIRRGETSGQAYVSALKELSVTGRLSSPPPRRARKDGTLMRVRSKIGDKKKSRVPEDRSGRYTDEKQGGRFREQTTFLPGGQRQHDIHMPKGKETKGRVTANDHLINLVRSAARGQNKSTQQRVELEVTFANGRKMQIKDYNASTLLDRFNFNAGGDALTWIAEQHSQRYPGLDTSQVAITGISVTVDRKPRSSDPRPYRPRET